MEMLPVFTVISPIPDSVSFLYDRNVVQVQYASGRVSLCPCLYLSIACIFVSGISSCLRASDESDLSQSMSRTLIHAFSFPCLLSIFSSQLLRYQVSNDLSGYYSPGLSRCLGFQLSDHGEHEIIPLMFLYIKVLSLYKIQVCMLCSLCVM